MAEAVSADLFEIRPAVPYTAADLDWTDPHSRSSVEMNDPAARPAMARRLETPDEYDTIYLGFPIWWYVAPRIVESFLESCDLTGKTLIPFATSGGSGMGETVAVLRRLFPAAVWKEGRVVNGLSGQALADWARSF